MDGVYIYIYIYIYNGDIIMAIYGIYIMDLWVYIYIMDFCLQIFGTPQFRAIPPTWDGLGRSGVPCHLLSHWHPHPMPRRVTGPEDRTGCGYVSNKLWDPGVTSPNLDAIKTYVQP